MKLKKGKLLLIMIISAVLVICTIGMSFAEEESEEKSLFIKALSNSYAHLSRPLELEEGKTYTFQADFRHGSSPGSSWSPSIHLHWAETNGQAAMIHFPTGSRIAFPGGDLSVITEPEEEIEGYIEDPEQWKWKGVKVELTTEQLKYYLRFDKGEWILIAEEALDVVEDREGMPSDLIVGKAWSNPDEGNLRGYHDNLGSMGENWIADIIITEDGEKILHENFVDPDVELPEGLMGVIHYLTESGWERIYHDENPEDVFQIVEK